MARITILAEQKLTFVYSADIGVFISNSNPSLFSPEVNETYSIIWDGEEYVCTAFENSAFPGNILLGNSVAIGGQDNGIPFFIGCIADYSGMTIFSFVSQLTHTIAVYQGEDTDTIILQDRDGNTVAYENVEAVRIDKEDGTAQIFTRGEAEKTTIDLDFSEGNMVVTPDEGVLFSKVTVHKPSNLVPENIAKDEVVAGIVGTHEGGGGGGDLTEPYVEYTFNDTGAVTEAKLYGFTSIPPYMFYNMTSLATVDTENSPNLTSVGNYAFYGCLALTSITLPDTVTSIGTYAFFNTGLTSFRIPTGVTVIPDYMLYNCTKLTSLTNLHSNITSIGNYSFYGIAYANLLWLPDNLVSIGNNAFQLSNITAVVMNYKLTTIGNYAFGGLPLNTITIPESVTKIGQYAFTNTNLNSATFLDTDGWYVSTSATATSGTKLTLTNTSTAATYLKSSYARYYWFNT